MTKLHLLFIHEGNSSSAHVYDSEEKRQEQIESITKSRKFNIPEMNSYTVNVDDELLKQNKLSLLHIVDVQDGIVSDIFRIGEYKDLLKILQTSKKRYETIHSYEKNFNVDFSSKNIFQVSSVIGTNYGSIKFLKVN